MSSQFEPTTSVTDDVDEDEAPVQSSARIRDRKVQKRRVRLLLLIVIFAGAILIAIGQDIGRVLFAMLTMYVLLRVGFAMIGGLARPMPEAPPPGELRKVKLLYRCSSCGAELRMTLANDENPLPPRHCAGEMDVKVRTEE